MLATYTEFQQSFSPLFFSVFLEKHHLQVSFSPPNPPRKKFSARSGLLGFLLTRLAQVQAQVTSNRHVENIYKNLSSLASTPLGLRLISHSSRKVPDALLYYECSALLLTSLSGK